MELNRFKQLLESTMGNVKPLIMEQQVDITECLTKLIDQDKPNSCKGTVDPMKCYEELKSVGGPFSSQSNPELTQAYNCVSEKLGMNK